MRTLDLTSIAPALPRRRDLLRGLLALVGVSGVKFNAANGSPGIELAPRITYTALDGKSRLVVLPRERFVTEPLGERFDCFIDDTDGFVIFREPIRG